MCKGPNHSFFDELESTRNIQLLTKELIKKEPSNYNGLGTKGRKENF